MQVYLCISYIHREPSWVLLLRKAAHFILIQVLSLPWSSPVRLGLLAREPPGSTCLCLSSAQIIRACGHT